MTRGWWIELDCLVTSALLLIGFYVMGLDGLLWASGAFAVASFVIGVVRAFRRANAALRSAVELPEVESAVRRHPAGNGRTASVSAGRGNFWATLGTPDVLATDRERRERADYELVKQKLKGVRPL